MSVYPVRNQNVETKGVKRDELSITRDLRNWKQEYKLHRRQPFQNLVKNHFNEDVFCEDLKPLLILLRTMGVLPLQRSKAGNINETEWAKSVQ
jgi:hypothetical protein